MLNAAVPIFISATRNTLCRSLCPRVTCKIIPGSTCCTTSFSAIITRRTPSGAYFASALRWVSIRCLKIVSLNTLGTRLSILATVTVIHTTFARSAVIIVTQAQRQAASEALGPVLLHNERGEAGIARSGRVLRTRLTALHSAALGGCWWERLRTRIVFARYCRV